VVVKKIYINYRIYFQTLIFFIVCVNHHEGHFREQKSSIILKLEISTTPYGVSFFGFKKPKSTKKDFLATKGLVIEEKNLDRKAKCQP
jgi:hypothetical protein